MRVNTTGSPHEQPAQRLSRVVASGAALDCVALSRQGTGAATSISIGASIRSTPLMAPTARRSLGPAGWTWACYAALPLAAWSVYWLAFFPGVIAHDSLVQWKEILDGRYDDWHPAFHTWTFWLLTRPWRSLGAVSLSQVLITGLLVGHFLATARRLGAPAWAPWSVAVWLALSPVFGMNVIAVWKDTAFGLALLWTTGLLLRSRARGVLTAGDGAWLGVALALMWLFRHNGPAPALPTLAPVARAPPPLDVRHALHLEPAIQAVDRAPVARRRRGGAQRTGRTGGLMAAVRAESARAARDCDLRSRVRVARPRVAACAVPVPTAGFPSRRVLARSVERSAPRLGPGSVQHARLAGARREPRPAPPVARRAARALARVPRDGGLAAGARLPPREGRRSLRPANQVA